MHFACMEGITIEIDFLKRKYKFVCKKTSYYVFQFLEKKYMFAYKKYLENNNSCDFFWKRISLEVHKTIAIMLVY